MSRSLILDAIQNLDAEISRISIMLKSIERAQSKSEISSNRFYLEQTDKLNKLMDRRRELGKELAKDA